VRFVHAGSDGLLLPTASFLLAPASLVASETASSSTRAWSSVLESLSGENQRRTFANVVAPFVSAGWNLVVVTKARAASVLWLTLRRDDTGDANDSSDSGAASTRYRSGILGVLLGPPPYQLAELHQLTAEQVNGHQVTEQQVIWQQVIWLAGKPEDRADVCAIPSDVDLWHADLTASADGDWVAIRSAPGHPLR
jgi:hypothetical protein